MYISKDDCEFLINLEKRLTEEFDNDLHTEIINLKNINKKLSADRERWNKRNAEWIAGKRKLDKNFGRTKKEIK